MNRFVASFFHQNPRQRVDEERGTGPGPVEEIVAEVKIAEVGE